MVKSQRKYLLSIQNGAGATDFTIIQLPFTLEFDISRNSFSSSNFGSFRIYNLNEQTRNLILQDRIDFDNKREVSLLAGYESDKNLSVVYRGSTTQCWSVREGVNFITQIESFFMFSYVNARISQSFPASFSQKQIITALVNSLDTYGITTGAIGNYDTNANPATERGNTYDGSTIDILRQLTNGGFYIDNGVANCLNQGDYLFTGETPYQIDSDNGLLNTPYREKSILRVDIIFEPTLRIGQLVNLVSSTNKIYNGIYQIVGLHHKGTISDSVSGEAITTIDLFFGNNLVNPVSIGGS